MRGTAREALVLGGGGDLPRILGERLGKLGHRVRCLQVEDAPPDLTADILVRLDTTPVRARAAVEMIQRAAAGMKDRAFGRIVHVSLTGSMSTFASAGTLAVLQDLARQLARSGVTINVVTLTPPPAGGHSPPPLQRQATMSEVAGLVEMLCHDEAGLMTAQSFPLVSAAT